MTWGRWGKQLDLKDMQSLIEHCLDIGITTFDHADIYGAYSTESNFGNAISAMAIERSQYQLISKCGIQYVCDARENKVCLLYTSPSPRDGATSRMPSSA